MAYNLELAGRLREQMQGLPGLEEKKMFGGVGFLLNGNMACGVHGEGMIVRVNPELHASLMKKAHVKPFDMTGRPMKGWLVVEAEGCRTASQLKAWVKQGVDFALSLPPREK